MRWVSRVPERVRSPWEVSRTSYHHGASSHILVCIQSRRHEIQVFTSELDVLVYDTVTSTSLHWVSQYPISQTLLKYLGSVRLPNRDRFTTKSWIFVGQRFSIESIIESRKAESSVQESPAFLRCDFDQKALFRGSAKSRFSDSGRKSTTLFGTERSRFFKKRNAKNAKLRFHSRTEPY